MPDPWKARREARLAREAAEREAIAIAEAEEQAAWEAFRESIRGDKGDKGDSIKGDPGERGLDGTHGTNGIDGLDGLPGTPGAPGRDGTDGRDGLDGTPGTPGGPGTRGLRGVAAPSVVSAQFRRDTGQRIEAVVEYLDDGNERTFTVDRDERGRPVGLTRG